MTDLISREALERRCKGSYLTPDDFRFEIRNAPAIEQGEAVAKVLFRQDEDGLEPIIFYSNDEYPKEEELKDRFVMMDVYLSKQQPQEKDELVNKAFAEALEEAAKICDDNLMSWADHEWNDASKDCAKRIRALIKRNEDGVE